MKKGVFVGLILLYGGLAYSQVPSIDHARNYDRSYKDSLKQVAKRLLLPLGKKNLSSQEIAQKSEIFDLLGSLYLEDDYRDLDTSMYYNDQLLQLARTHDEKEWQISALLRREIKYRRAHDYGKSLEVSLEASKICEELGGNCTKSWMIQQNLGQSFLRSGDYANSEKYLKTALRQLQQAPIEDEALRKKFVLGVYSLMSNLYQQWKKYDLAISIFEKQLEVAQTLKNKNSLAGSYEEIGDFYTSINHPGKALPYLSKAFALFTEVGHTRGIASVTNSLGETFLQLKDYNKAKTYAGRALSLANQHHYATLKPYAYQTLAIAHEKTGNELEALRAYHQAALLRDSLGFSRRLVALADIQRVYEVDKARFEQQIALQERTRNFLLIGLVSLSLFGIALIFYSRTLRQKNQELAHKKKEIEEAFLKGQTTERKRVATELHDNLGGLLSAAKLSLQILDPSQLNQHEREIYENIIEMMIDACRQVRTLSHNMLPEELEKQGLVVALERLVYKLNRVGTTQFSFQTNIETPTRLGPESEFNIYSIGLELCNNVLKHARASKAFITLQNSGQRLILTVADDGRGLPPDSDGEGMGFDNIRQRTHALRGTFSIATHTNSGTVITVNVPLDITTLETVYTA
ncbi:MAG: ATP-binding protein [Runella sp.]